ARWAKWAKWARWAIPASTNRAIAVSARAADSVQIGCRPNFGRVLRPTTAISGIRASHHAAAPPGRGREPRLSTAGVCFCRGLLYQSDTIRLDPSHDRPAP